MTPFWSKKVEVPEADDRTKKVDAVQLWTVRWTSRHGIFSSDTRPQIEAFASEAEANQFAADLRMAFRLTRITAGNDVSVGRN